MDYSHNPYSAQLISNSSGREKHEQLIVKGHRPHHRRVSRHRRSLRRSSRQAEIDFILVARSEAPLQALAATLSRSTGRRTTPIVADINNEQDLAWVEAKLKDDPSITMLVNTAGCASGAMLLDADIEKMEDMIALNICALTRLTWTANSVTKNSAGFGPEAKT